MTVLLPAGAFVRPFFLTFLMAAAVAANAQLTAWQVTSSMSSTPASLVLYNTSDTSTTVRATVYSNSGDLLCDEVTVISDLAPNARGALSPAAIETACGISPWSGAAQVIITTYLQGGDSGPALQAQQYLRSGNVAINFPEPVSGTAVTAWYVPGSSSSLRALLRVYNTGNATTNVHASLYAGDGTVLCDDVRVLAALAANSNKSLFAADLEAACSLSPWSSAVRVVLTSKLDDGEQGPALRLLSTLLNSGSLITDMTLPASGVQIAAVSVPSSTSSLSSFLRVYNTSATTTNVLASIYASDGAVLCDDVTVISAIGANAHRVLTAADLETHCSISPWSGSVRVLLTSQLDSGAAGPELQLLHTIRHADGTLINMSGVVSGVVVTSWHVPSSTYYNQVVSLKVANPGSTATNIVATIYDKDGSLLCSGASVIPALGANATATVRATHLETACGIAPWSSFARVILFSQLDGGGAGPEIQLQTQHSSAGYVSNISEFLGVLDSDSDGFADGDYAFPVDGNEWIDTDGDGIGNNADTDDDGDGVADNEDAFPLDAAEWLDTDGDGIGNNVDTDDDDDGVADDEDALPLNAGETVDTDGDGIGNNADTDDDGDGVADNEDAFPLDAAEWLDTDGDGIGNNVDTDDDDDGVADDEDALPLDASRSTVSAGGNSSSGGYVDRWLLVLLLPPLLLRRRSQ